jgi:glycosyltransferase involved in cell wall biosynthesis
MSRATALENDCMMSSPRIVAVLPAYNLEASIGQIVERTKPFVDYVIVVADGSRDSTGAAAARAGAIVPPPDQVRGKGYAVIKGFAHAMTVQPDIVVLMDSDGQHLPEEIPQLVEPLRGGDIDMVVGSRMLGTLRTSTINKFGNFGLKLISFMVTGTWMTDTESGFRAFRAQRLFEMHLSARGYEIESELLLKALHRGFRMKEVPIHVPFAVPGVTVWDGVKVGWYKVSTGIRLKLGRERA